MRRVFLFVVAVLALSAALPAQAALKVVASTEDLAALAREVGTIDQPALGRSFTFEDVDFDGRPFESPQYYGWRVGRLFGQARTFGIELEFIHLKVIGRTDRAYPVSGLDTLDTSESGALVMNTVVQRYAMTHGLNFALINMVMRTPVRGPVTLVWRAGAGPTLPHAETTIDGQIREQYRVRWARRSALRGARHQDVAVALHHGRVQIYDRPPGDRCGRRYRRHDLSDAPDRGRFRVSADALISFRPVLSSACALALGLALSSTSQTITLAPPVDRPFHQLLPNLVTDFRSLPSRDTALIAAVGTAATFALKPVDDQIEENGKDEDHSQYAELGSWLGNGWVQAGAAITAYTVGVAIKHRPTRHIGSDLIRAQLVNGLVTRVLKVSVDRERPDGGGHSFPSGHASGMFTTAGVLGAHFGWRVALPAYAISGFVGWARVRDDQHWATDVAAGATIGAIIGHSVARLHDSSWMVVPTVSTSGKGIMIVKN